MRDLSFDTIHRRVFYYPQIREDIRVDRQGSQDYSEIRANRNFNKNFPLSKLI